MKNTKRIFSFIIILSFLSGCSTAEMFTSEKDDLLFSEITELYDQINNGDWDGALSNVNKFQNNYKDQQWKLLLLGTIDQFHDLELEVESLKEYVKDEDDVESMLGLREIKYQLYTIYNI